MLAVKANGRLLETSEEGEKKLRVIMEECGAPQKQLAKMNPVSAISYFEK